MRNRTFGELLRAARQERNWTQLETIDKVNKNRSGAPLSQATLSAWEKNKQKPSANHRKASEVLWNLLSIKEDMKEALESSVEVQNDEPTDTPEQQYRADLQELLSGNKSVEIWMFTSDELKAHNSLKMVTTWADNIRNGCAYHMVIPTGLVNDVDLADDYAGIIDELNELFISEPPVNEEGVTEKVHSRIKRRVNPGLHLHVIFEDDSNNPFNPTVQRNFRILKENIEQSNEELNFDVTINLFQKDKEDGDNSEQNLTSTDMYTIHNMIPPIGRLAVYCNRAKGTFETEATLMIPNSRSRRTGATETIYTWLDSNEAKRFNNNINVLSSALNFM